MVPSKTTLLALGTFLILTGHGRGQPVEVNGAIARWSFDEGSGGSALDSSGNGNDAAIVGAAYISGPREGALVFDGVDDYLFASDAESGGVTGSGLDMGTRDWTVSAWIKTVSSGMLVTKMGFIGGANPDGWGMSVSGNGTLGAHISKSNGDQVNVFAGDGRRVDDGQWHHVAVVFQRSGSMSRFVDGGLSGARYDLSALAGQSIDNDRRLEIGARDQAGDEIFFGGQIDEVRVYPRALDAAEVAALAGLTEPPEPPPSWSPPVMLVSAHGRVAVGNRVHVAGHIGGNMVHRSSPDGGATWSAPAAIAPASSNYPMQYGGLFAAGDAVYLLTAAGDMGGSSQPLDFRKSADNGSTWSKPIRITRAGEEIRRANIQASGDSVHVFGGQSGAGGYGTGIFYFRSRDGGATWDPGVPLYAEADASARMAVDGTTLHVAFGAKISPASFGGRTSYMRSTDNGTTWSDPVFIGEDSAESDVQARQQIVAADGRVFVMWQRERPFAGGPLPADRLGYNRSEDGGRTWSGPKLLPHDTGIDREHHQLWMVSGGGLHAAWAHGLPSDPSTPTGYMFSPDYGATWGDTEIAISTSAGNLPHGIVADSQWVHIIAEPGAGTYARSAVGPRYGGPRFRRGDANSDGAIDLGDAVAILFALLAAQPISCEKAADAQDDGAVDISDAVFLLEYLFLGQKAPEEPLGACGVDPTMDELTCESFPACR
jgi:concanavalin A-like lectin/glucanase superfamily protein/BNR repeat protein/dockerin type I repeat protein